MVTKRTEEIKNDKIQRILGIYTKLMDGKTVNKQEKQHAITSIHEAFSETLKTSPTF